VIATRDGCERAARLIEEARALRARDGGRAPFGASPRPPAMADSTVFRMTTALVRRRA